MEHSFWHNKWQLDQVGFHQENGHPELVKYFPKLSEGSSVLVPLCGKTKDMLWLVEQGYRVTGVELSEIAARDFFKENGLTAQVSERKVNGNDFNVFQCDQLPIVFVVGDFFNFNGESFDALYDRAALIALPQEMRADYIRHCQSLLKASSHGLIITTVYDQSVASGPPFSVLDEELISLWNGHLERVGAIELIEEEPRWKSKGLTSFKEHIWVW
ncbi:thiopurine S-methyltransferase [Litoribrevibacter euphylliae]|uniref:Thiopurine S-methyltransferase n=1 Tax=Litoribrevibacter euphylliae TaxID=1834034 RepID=A0ABV7H840_9GAMM